MHGNRSCETSFGGGNGLHACGAVFPLAIATSICLSSVTICSALYFRIDISSFLLREILSHFRWFKKGRSGHELVDRTRDQCIGATSRSLGVAS